MRESGLYRGRAYAVLREIADAANHDGQVSFIDVELVAVYARMSVRQVQRRIAELEADGMLVRDISGGHHGRLKQWRINVARLLAARNPEYRGSA